MVRGGDEGLSTAGRGAGGQRSGVEDPAEGSLEAVGTSRPESRPDFAARLLASIGQPVVVVDTGFRVVYWNSGAEQSLGWPASEIIGTDVIKAAGINLTDEVAEAIFARLQAGEEVVEDFAFTRRDGHRFPLLVNLTPFLDGNGRFSGMVAIATDVTERRAMEKANSQLSAIIESSTDAIVGFDLAGELTSWNGAAARLFGIPPLRAGEVPSALARPGLKVPPFLDLAPGEVSFDRAPFAAALTAADGTAVQLEVAVHSVRDSNGRLIGGAARYRDVSRRYEAERQAAEEHQRLEEAQQIAHLGSFSYDLASHELAMSRELRRILGFGSATPSVEQFRELIHPDDVRVFEEQLLDQVVAGNSTADVTYRIRRSDGSDRSLRTLCRVVRDEAGAALRIVGSTQDITDAAAKEEARRLAEQRFSVAFELGSVGMLMLDLDRVILQVNPTVCHMLGRTADEIVGQTPDAFCHPDDLRPAGQSATEVLLSSDHDHLEFESRYLRANGDVIHAIVHLAVNRDSSGTPVNALAQLVDITDRKRAEEELERLAMQDPLTGLPNRNLLQDRLWTALGRSQRAHSTIAVLFVDVDRFKLVNDSLGHSAGDDLLRQLARRLGVCARSGDTVARFGGDEFVLVCEDVMSTDEARAIGRRVGAVCEEPFLIQGHEMYVTASVGIVLAAEGDTPVTLLRDADTAMYQAKDRGRARAELFDAKLRSRATRRLDIELALRHALERGEFRLEYQPIVELEPDRPIAAEALIRWEHPEKGLVGPGEFVRAAEETGLIVPIGEWVLEQAVAQVATWRRTLLGASDFVIAVNLSPRQLSAALLGKARDILAAYGLPPDGLCLEVTESTAMDDVEVSLPLLRRLAESGIVIAIDDFGSGYSSLGRLKHLPVRSLKIDGSFIDGLGIEPDDSSIVNAIVRLGQALNLKLCAEGVETAVQREELVRIGCHRAQGFLWAKPMAPEAFGEWYSAQLLSSGAGS